MKKISIFFLVLILIFAETYSPNLSDIGHNERIVENLNASKVELKDEEFRSLEEALDGCRVYGHRGFRR